MRYVATSEGETDAAGRVYTRRWIVRGHWTLRMSAGCVQIGAGFAHVADAKKAAPTRNAMSEWGQQAIESQAARSAAAALRAPTCGRS